LATNPDSGPWLSNTCLDRSDEARVMRRALIVDDDPSFVLPLADFVAQRGFSVATARGVREAEEYLAANRPDLMILDLLLPDGSGLDLLEEMDAESDTRVLVVTAHPSLDATIESLRAKVYDFLIKPLDVGRLRKVLDDLGRGAPVTKLPAYHANPDDSGLLGILVGRSSAMKTLYAAVEKVAPSNATVMLFGESGSGKELVAQAVHRLSDRANRPFVALNCGAVPENLIDSELFGHERGAFTGAHRQHKGAFERASGGTLFLDEVTEMPAEQQVHLLRVLETAKVRRLGGSEELEINVRVIAATNRDPELVLAQGRMREDLYFRLMVFPLRLPPLRERGSDILLLAEQFLSLLNAQQGLQVTLSDDAKRALMAHDWPGNVRELRNTIQRAFLLADGREIDAQHVSGWRSGPSANGEVLTFAVGTPLDAVERRLIEATLEHFQGDKRETAKALGISLKTLYNRLNEYRRVDEAAER
jgi:DNA-binding NtrC family response regulator